MAATVQVEAEGDTNPLLEQALKIGDECEEKEEEEQRKSPAEPKVGSFEGFMTTFGNPARWAGR